MNETAIQTREPAWLAQQMRERSAAIAEIADQIASFGQYAPSALDEKARLVFLRQPPTRDQMTCLICGVPLLGRQWQFCSGHWDYIFMVIPHGSLFELSFREQLVADLDALQGLKVRLLRPYWWGLMKGAYKCEVCDALQGLQESIITGDGSEVRRHTVCADHVTFRGNPLANDRKYEES